MKRSILCLLVLLSLCVCLLFVSCKKEDVIVNAPDAAGVGKDGQITTEKVQGEVELDVPDVQIPGYTTRE